MTWQPFLLRSARREGQHFFEIILFMGIPRGEVARGWRGMWSFCPVGGCLGLVSLTTEAVGAADRGKLHAFGRGRNHRRTISVSHHCRRSAPLGYRFHRPVNRRTNAGTRLLRRARRIGRPITGILAQDFLKAMAEGTLVRAGVLVQDLTGYLIDRKTAVEYKFTPSRS